LHLGKGLARGFHLSEEEWRLLARIHQLHQEVERLAFLAQIMRPEVGQLRVRPADLSQSREGDCFASSSDEVGESHGRPPGHDARHDLVYSTDQASHSHSATIDRASNPRTADQAEHAVSQWQELW
jgi:hypothetical protein